MDYCSRSYFPFEVHRSLLYYTFNSHTELLLHFTLPDFAVMFSVPFDLCHISVI